MASSEYPLSIEAGTTYNLAFVYSAGATTALATPVNLPGYQGRMVISSQQGASTPVYTLTQTNGGTYSTPTQGVFGATLTAAQTAAIHFTSGYYRYDIVSNAATPVVKRLLKGKLSIDRD